MADGLGHPVGKFMDGHSPLQLHGEHSLVLSELVALLDHRPKEDPGADQDEGQQKRAYLLPVLGDKEERRHQTSPRYLAARLKMTAGYSLTAA